ncbi:MULTISPECIES: P27 family phage terminase small subunit [unclassified Mesorhizobium]|uniref:P27 family phage terminase small subunit n=1 Tax=unclassified Mesorhizobium TaxID=325217 RepID=UPI003335E5E2
MSNEAAKWWRSVVTDFELEGHHLRLLQLAAEAWDRSQQARAVTDKEGITTVDDRKNVRAHPAVGIEKDARTGFARLVRELDLDVEVPPSRTRPPGSRSNRRGVFDAG